MAGTRLRMANKSHSIGVFDPMACVTRGPRKANESVHNTIVTIDFAPCIVHVSSNGSSVAERHHSASARDRICVSPEFGMFWHTQFAYRCDAVRHHTWTLNIRVVFLLLSFDAKIIVVIYRLVRTQYMANIKRLPIRRCDSQFRFDALIILNHFVAVLTFSISTVLDCTQHTETVSGCSIGGTCEFMQKIEKIEKKYKIWIYLYCLIGVWMVGILGKYRIHSNKQTEKRATEMRDRE